MNKPTLTVFTPAYNRAHTLGRTYESLCRQTCNDFCWLVVDDGSTDNTRLLVEGWIAEGLIPIQYIYQENQGMHGAHNTAYANIDTELNTCIDSDDWMPDGAVEKIVTFWREHGSDKYAGLVGLDVDSQGKIIGDAFPSSVITATTCGFKKLNVRGDKKIVYRTDIIKKYPHYPIFPGERYVGLDYLYMSIDQDYELLIINDPLVVVEYQLDGSSNNMWQQYWNNPKGWVFYRLHQFDFVDSLSERFKIAVHYVASCIRAGKWSFFKDNKYTITTVISIPFGLAFYILMWFKHIKH